MILLIDRSFFNNNNFENLIIEKTNTINTKNQYQLCVISAIVAKNIELKTIVNNKIGINFIFILYLK